MRRALSAARAGRGWRVGSLAADLRAVLIRAAAVDALCVYERNRKVAERVKTALGKRKKPI